MTKKQQEEIGWKIMDICGIGVVEGATLFKNSAFIKLLDNIEKVTAYLATIKLGENIQ